MASLALYCVPASDGVAVAPCGTVGTVAYAPVMAPPPSQTLDFSGSGQLFAFTLSVVLISFVVGHVVGSILRVIRSA